MRFDSLARERQHEEILSLVRRAGGAPVKYSELSEAGIDLPATLVAELEEAGAPIERTHSGDERDPAAVRLDPARDPAWARIAADWAQPVLSAPSSPAPGVESSPSQLNAGRLLALLALLTVVGVVLGLVLGATSPGSPAPRPVAHPSVNSPRHAHARIAERAPALVGLVPPPLLPAVSAPRPQAHPTARPTAPRTAPSAKTTAQPAEAGSTATQLEAVGHSLLEQGQYSAAITVLQHAMAATGEGTGTCVEPRGPDCLTYAFALYDLGRALRLGGNPAAAVPILERRMRIKNHRKIVASELRLARRGSD